ncbi:MAG: acetyl-CoA carboxylase carboxyltransferase subunit alpha [Simkaniaceae bacterium]|nr:acetyl-CoA carboxylase carboxyltransferase subunit alpha [Simkaniaceae bacterium]
MIPEHEKRIYEYEEIIAKLKEQSEINGIRADEDIARLEEKLEEMKKEVYSNLTPWQRVLICRHAKRPRSTDYIRNLFDEFEEISGDRLFRNDPAIITGLGVVAGVKFMIIGQEKGHDTESRLFHNFGMPHPEGYRKALRAMKLAEKFALPVLSLIDTPGAYPGLAAEERGQGSAIAVNLFEMASLTVPVIVIVIGEGCSGGALGIGLGDAVAMLEHSYYSVISPEGCASILWKDPKKNEEATEALKIRAEDLLAFGVIDTVIREPLGGAHHDPDAVYSRVRSFLLKEEERLNALSPDLLVDKRYGKFRAMGAFSTVR